jgi:histidyl-tRNA synthetase
MSGVGISFGLDRIYLVLEELQLFPNEVTTGTKVLFLNVSEEKAFLALQTILKLRKNNIKAELYPDTAKFDKQFKHAEKRNIPFVVKDVSPDSFEVKNLISGEQTTLNFSELTTVLQ